jgi:dodecin
VITGSPAFAGDDSLRGVAAKPPDAESRLLWGSPGCYHSGRSRIIWTAPNGFRRTPQEAGGESREDFMAKKSNGTGVYRIVDVVGVSKVSWEDAAKRAVETAAQSIRDLRIAEVTKMDLTVENGTVSAFRTRVALSFKYEK